MNRPASSGDNPSQRLAIDADIGAKIKVDLSRVGGANELGKGRRASIVERREDVQLIRWQCDAGCKLIKKATIPVRRKGGRRGRTFEPGQALESVDPPRRQDAVVH